MKLQKTLSTKDNRIIFLSDLHYGHANVIKHDSRVYPDLGTMDQAIREVLSGIGPGDIVFDLGDTFWKTDTHEIGEVLDLMKGAELHKVMGNHDAYGLYWGASRVMDRWYSTISDILEISVNHEGQTYNLVLSHYPLVSWNHKTRGAFQVHGHCHGNIDAYNTNSPDLRVDVGVASELCKSSASGWFVTFEELLGHIKMKGLGRDYVLTNCTEL